MELVILMAASDPVLLSKAGTAGLTFTRYADRESWLEARRFSIGSSDAAALMGESNWATATTLNYAKRALLPPADPDLEREEELEWHRRRESEVADWWWTRLQLREPNLYWKRAGQEVFLWDPGDYTVAVREVDGVPLSATFDRVLLLDSGGAHTAALNIDSYYRGRNPRYWDAEDLSLLWAEIVAAIVAPVELKNAGAYMGKHWTEEPPLIFQLQVQHQMLVAGSKAGYLLASIGGQPPVWAELQADGEVRHVLRSAYRRFWESVVGNYDLPTDYREVTSKAISARYAKDDGSTIKLPDEAQLWWKNWKGAHDACKVHQQRKDEAKNNLAQMFGEASYGLLADGTEISYKADARGHRRLRQVGGEDEVSGDPF